MKRYWCVLILALYAFSRPQPLQDEKILINKVKAKLDMVKDYQANGEMKINVSFINAAPSKVTVYFKKPDQFRIKKADGISILPKGGVSINISSLLLADEKYEAIFAGYKDVGGTRTKMIKLIPLDEKSQVVISTFYIDEKALLIRKAAITTRENGSYEIDLAYGKYSNWGLPDKVTFTFNTKDYKLPKGIAVEYDKGGSKPPAKATDTKGAVILTYSGYIINKGIDDKVFREK
jgi:hypothetical protein